MKICLSLLVLTLSTKNNVWRCQMPKTGLSNNEVGRKLSHKRMMGYYFVTKCDKYCKKFSSVYPVFGSRGELTSCLTRFFKHNFANNGIPSYHSLLFEKRYTNLYWMSNSATQSTNVWLPTFFFPGFPVNFLFSQFVFTKQWRDSGGNTTK